jgi:osmotically-inducible protein OsmY
MMKNSLKAFVLASALMLPLASVAADGDSVGTKLNDTVVTTKVKAAFAKDKLVNATDIKVETDSDGLVQLSGTAKSKAEAKKAVEIAKSVKGVTAVKDDIVVTN